MSHWQGGKIKNGCTISQLKRLLKGMRDTWEIVTKEDEGVELDGEGGITARSNYQDGKSGMDLIIRMNSGAAKPGARAKDGSSDRGNVVRGADVGFKKMPDGSWQVWTDMVDGIPHPDNFEGYFGQTMAKLRLKSLAAQEQAEYSEMKQGTNIIIDLDVPIEDFESPGGIMERL